MQYKEKKTKNGADSKLLNFIAKIDPTLEEPLRSDGFVADSWLRKALCLMLIFSCSLAICETNTPEESASAPAQTSLNQKGRFSVGFGGADLAGTWGFGGNIDVQFRLRSAPLYLGLMSGAYHYSESASGGADSPSMTVWQIPIAPTVIYRFDIADSSIHPYAGIAAGIAIFNGTLSGASFLSGSSTSVKFQGLFRSGVEFDLSPNTSLAIEPSLGLIDDGFNFLPHAALFLGF